MEREILERVMRGDIDAYRVVVERYKEEVYFIALGFSGNPEDAFVRAYKFLKTFDPSSPGFIRY